MYDMTSIRRPEIQIHQIYSYCLNPGGAGGEEGGAKFHEHQLFRTMKGSSNNYRFDGFLPSVL